MASKTLQSTIEISGVLSPSLQAAIKNAVNKLDEMSEETLKSAGAAEKLSAEIGAQESVLKSLQKGYADYIVSGKESSDEAQTLADKIQELSGELDENKGTLQAAERAAKKLADTQDDAGDAYSRLERKVSSQQDELATLRREYANVVLEQGKTSREAKQLESKIGSLSKEVAKGERELRELGEAAEEAGRKAEDSGEGYTVLKNVIANLASEAISKAVEAFKELATEGDSALGMLEARTGAAGHKMEGFEDVMYEVYNANYGESLGDVSEKLSTVIQMTDNLDNASLAKVTKSAIALEDVFGFDVNESMRAVNSLMDQFGITSDQAFNLVVQGAQNGLNQNDDLLDTINEYSVQFKNAGYSADDMFNMLSNGASTGTWSVDKLGDAVKEFNIRASDGTITDAIVENAKAFGMTKKEANALGTEIESGSVESYQKLLDKLKEVDDDAQRYQMGVAMFGTMWEDLGEEAVFALMDTEGAISKTSNAMEKMDTAAYDTLAASVSQLGRTLKAEVAQPIMEVVTPALKGTVDFITNNLPVVGVIIGGVTAAIAAFKIAAWSAKLATEGFTIATKLQAIAQGALNAVMNANPIGLIILAVTALVAGFMVLWKKCEGFRNFWIGLWDGIKKVVGVAVDWIKGCWEKIKEFFTGDNPIARYFQMGWNNIKIIWDTVVSYFKTIWENIKLVFSAVKSVFKGDFSGAWDAVKQIFANWGEFFSGLWDNVKKIFANVGNFFGPIFSGAWEKIKAVFAPVGEFFSGIWSSVSSACSNAWNSVVSFLSKAWETIKNVVKVGVMFVGSILNAAFQIITLPFRFIWENCKEYVFAAWEWIKEKVTVAINAVKSVITNVMNVIRSVISTIWNGIKTATSAVWNAIKSVISSVWTAIKTRVTAAINAVKSVVSSVWNGIKSVTSTVWNAIKGVISAVWNAIKSVVTARINEAKAIVSNVWNGIKSVTSSVWNGIKSGVSGAVNAVKSTVSNVFNGIKNTATSVWNGIKNAILTPIEAAKNKIKGIIDTIKGFFSGMKLNLPKIKLPHFKIKGDFSISPPSVPKLSIDWYKEGGIMTRPTIFGASGNNLLAGGEAGAEAVLPLSVLWDKMEAMLRNIINGTSTTGEPSGEGLTSKAGELLTLDNFSLGSLADGTNVVIYYDFSGFTWSPQIHADGTGDDEDDLMARLRAHEAEFFDWLEEFIQMREVAQYA